MTNLDTEFLNKNFKEIQNLARCLPRDFDVTGTEDDLRFVTKLQQIKDLINSIEESIK